MSTISVGRRPNRSAIIPNRNAPTGRKASVMKHRLRHRRNLRLKLRGQRADAENQNEKIKRVQRPPQKTGDERVPLHRSKPTKMSDEFHASV